MKRDDLTGMSKSALEALAEDMGLIAHGMKKAELIDAILSQSAEPAPRPAEVAEATPEPAEEPEAAPVALEAPVAAEFYVVSKVSRYAVDGFCHNLPAGMIVSNQTHDIGLMRAQGVALSPAAPPTEGERHAAPGRIGQLRALTGSAPESAMSQFNTESQSYYQLGPDGEYLPVEPIAVAPNVSILATLK